MILHQSESELAIVRVVDDGDKLMWKVHVLSRPQKRHWRSKGVTQEVRATFGAVAARSFGQEATRMIAAAMFAEAQGFVEQHREVFEALR